MNKWYGLALVCNFVSVMYGMEKTDYLKIELYVENSELQYHAAMEYLKTIHFKGDEKVLDIDCGDGRITREIANKVPGGIVLGIDTLPNVIRYARKNNAQKNLTFELCDISKSQDESDFKKLFSSDSKFDFIVAFSSLSWTENKLQVFKNVFYLLKGGGELRAGLAHENSPYLQARFAMLTHDTWKKYFVNYKAPYYPSNEEKIKRLLRDALLCPIKIEKMGSPREITREYFINFIRAIPIQINEIPEDRRTEFLNDTVDEYLKRVPLKANGLIEVTFSTLVVRANAFYWPL